MTTNQYPVLTIKLLNPGQLPQFPSVDVSETGRWKTFGLSEEDLELDDYLLDWKKDGIGYRYAHQLDEAEVVELAQEAGLTVIEQFHADGREGDLSLYTVLEW